MDIPQQLLQIKSLNKEGFGVANYTRPDGLVRQVVIPYCLPEEEIEATLRKTKRSYAGHIEKVIKTSPDRVASRCVHFGACGGCRFQHMSYDAQLTVKEKEIRELFADYEELFLPIIESPGIWNYRNKMEFSFSEDSKGQKFLGLYLSQSRGKVFTLTECHLVASWMAETLQNVRAWWESGDLTAFHPHKNEGSLRTVTLRESRTSHDRVIILTVSGRPEFALKQSHIESFVAACMPAKPEMGELSIILCIHQQVKGKPTEFFEMRLFGPDYFRERFEIEVNDEKKTFEFHISPRSFVQPNSLQASRLYSKALQLAEIQKHEVLYDLYAGIGVFGMCAAHLAKEVVSIELNPDAAYDATTNKNRLGFDNVQTFKGDVATILKEKTFSLPDVVLVDPPRSGLGPKAVAEITSLKPKRIVYVSCNPATQAVDVKLLVEAGYTVKIIQPIDQFPHTLHVENIVVLQRVSL
jgi:23S rRNA (uracil1939-C5)-methyltransferase